MNLSVENLEFKSRNLDKNKFHIAGLDGKAIDIQTINNEALEKIFHNRNLELDDVPRKSEVISIENQSQYYKSIKTRLSEQISAKKFAILEGPTGTGKTTLAKTYAYESSTPIYEIGADGEKSIEDFTTEIKTYRKNNMLQIKEIPGILHKAIVTGSIILINEANSLFPDIQLAIANMTEGGFIVVGTKKIKVHPNFALIFTSNDKYAGTEEYNNAVIRKAGGIINFDYEPTLEGELQIVRNIHEKIKSKLDEKKEISDNDLKKITRIIREIRKDIGEHNEKEDLRNKDNDDLGNKLITQDLNNFGDFFYTRLYEDLLNNILNSGQEIHSLEEEINKIVLPRLKDIYGIIGGFEIFHNNDEKLLKRIISRNVKNENIKINIDSNKQILDLVVFETLQNSVGENSGILENFTTNGEINGNKRKNIFKKQLNPNIFKRTMRNEVNSKGKELHRIENFYNFIEGIHSQILDSDNRIIGNIRRETLKSGEKVLSIEISGNLIYFYSENENELKGIKNEKDVKEKIFGNKNIKIFYFDNENNKIGDASEIESLDCIDSENIFENPKVLEIRRFSKIIKREDSGKKFISFLGFSGEIRDIRYEDDEGNLYIPNSKVNEILLSNYEIIQRNNKKFQNAKNGKHFLVLNSQNKVEFLTKEKIEKESEDLTILSKIKNEKTNHKLDNEIKKKFTKIDKLNFYNGGIEKTETATPENIYGNQKPISSRVYDILNPNFGGIISKTTDETLDEIEYQISIGKDILLTGPSGVGKSSYASEIAKRLNLPYISIQIDSNSEEKTFSSNPKFNESEIEETFTPFLDFYINGGVVELKELNMASSLTFLNDFLDKNGKITVNGQTYERNKNFFIIATTNDFDNRLFPGTNPINTSNEARFTEFKIDYIKDIIEERDLLFSYTKIENENLIEKIGEKKLKAYIGEILKLLVFPIRQKTSELRKSQESGTDEELKILSKKIMTVDIFKRILINSKGLEDFREKIKIFFNFTNEEKKFISYEIKNEFKKLNF